MKFAHRLVDMGTGAGNRSSIDGFSSVGRIMDVFMVGVNHLDPLGRTDLLARLRALASRHSNPPAFVAVEYDQHHFRSIVCQRDRFRSLIETKCGGLTTAELDAYANSLAYDGDSHHDIFPDVPVLWLDEDRKCSNSDLAEYPELRLAIYLRRSGNDLRCVEKLSCAIKAVPTQTNTSTPFWKERNETFARRICDRIREINGSWAIAITGKEHACNSVSGSMCQLLEAAGVNCVKG